MKLSKETKDRWNKVTKKDLYELTFKQGLSDAVIADCIIKACGYLPLEEWER